MTGVRYLTLDATKEKAQRCAPGRRFSGCLTWPQVAVKSPRDRLSCLRMLAVSRQAGNGRPSPRATVTARAPGLSAWAWTRATGVPSPVHAPRRVAPVRATGFARAVERDRRAVHVATQVPASPAAAPAGEKPPARRHERGECPAPDLVLRPRGRARSRRPVERF